MLEGTQSISLLVFAELLTHVGLFWQASTPFSVVNTPLILVQPIFQSDGRITTVLQPSHRRRLRQLNQPDIHGFQNRLAEQIHNLLKISLAPSVTASLQNIPTKYNIIVRLRSYAFHKLLKSLRRQSFTSQFALEHLQDFIYYAYTFYSGLVEDPILSTFKSGGSKLSVI